MRLNSLIPGLTVAAKYDLMVTFSLQGFACADKLVGLINFALRSDQSELHVQFKIALSFRINYQSSDMIKFSRCAVTTALWGPHCKHRTARETRRTTAARRILVL